MERASILRFNLDGAYVGDFRVPPQLPWGMTAFRDARGAALYVCLDEPFDAVNYGTPNPSGNRGAVLVIPLRDDGAALPVIVTPRCLPRRASECCRYAAAQITTLSSPHRCLKDPSRNVGAFAGILRAGLCGIKWINVVSAS